MVDLPITGKYKGNGMKRFMYLAVVLSIASLLAKWVSEKFVVKGDENDPDGFVLQTAGFGMDDVAVGLTFGLIGALTLSFIGPR